MMKCDLEGLLLNALDCDESMRGYYEHGFHELLKNLREFKQRSEAGDPTVAREFFDLYVLGQESA